MGRKNDIGVMSDEQTKPVLFHLRRYFVIQSSFKANREFESNRLEEIGLDVDATMYQSKKQKNVWNITITIKTKDGTNPETCPYLFEVTLFGVFVCPQYLKMSKDERVNFKKLFYVNGCSVLYSTARELIRGMTASGPYRPCILPTFRFDPEDAEESLVAD